MRVLLQRVSGARVDIAGETVAKINDGLLLLVGFGRGDEGISPDTLTRASDKLLNLRVFANTAGKLDHSVLDIGHAVLAVPQFTLYGKSEKGRRPDFGHALAPALAEPAFEQFVKTLATGLGKPVPGGRFGADMQVSLINDGPFTMMLEF